MLASCGEPIRDKETRLREFGCVGIARPVREQVPLRRRPVRVTGLFACTNIPGTPAAAVSVSAVWRSPCHGRNDSGTPALRIAIRA